MREREHLGQQVVVIEVLQVVDLVKHLYVLSRYGLNFIEYVLIKQEVFPEK